MIELTVPCWLPIEDAPLDGTEIIGCSEGHADVEFYRYFDGLWVTRGDYFEPTNALTHWMPKPLPPNAGLTRRSTAIENELATSGRVE